MTSFAWVVAFTLLVEPVPKLTLPAEVAAAPGRVTRLTAVTDGAQVRWAAFDPAEVDLIPFPDGKTALFCAAKPGRYVVLAWTAAGDVPSEAARCVVVVSNAPVPPEPGSLTAELRKLIADDSGATREQVELLAAVYREATKYADRPDVPTAAELAARIRAAAQSLLPPTALVAVRKRLAQEIAKQLPADGEQPLDAATRKKAAALFETLATSLEAAR